MVTPPYGVCPVGCCNSVKKLNRRQRRRRDCATNWLQEAPVERRGRREEGKVREKGDRGRGEEMQRFQSPM